MTEPNRGKGAHEAASARRQRALDLRCAGAGYRAIGKELGTSHVQAFRDVQFALDEIAQRTREKAEKLRDLELQRCDKMTLALWPKLRAGDEKAARALVAVMDRRAKLLGLDVPQKHEVTGAEGGPLLTRIERVITDGATAQRLLDGAVSTGVLLPTPR